MRLLTSNTKLDKARDLGYLQAAIVMAPASLSGTNLCIASTESCRNACVMWHNGHHNGPTVRNAQLERTRLYLDDREKWQVLLDHDIEQHEKKANRLDLQSVVRPNGATDVDQSGLAWDHPDTLFMDYTKVVSRMNRLLRDDWPSNYELTYSWNERSKWHTATKFLREGINVAMVFDTPYLPERQPLPTQYFLGGKCWPVIDGDRHDVRLHEEDGHGVIVGLRFKGSNANRAAGVESGFVRRGAA